ncbi:MAG TPA: ROK family protein [Candidatus Sulfotelmatobacter sp.]|nr:ROK family protein [Candidatus Sulfotelmatobacter sp.]
MGRLVLGVDIGGTKVAAGTVNEAGEILSKARVPMIANQSAPAAMECVHRAIQAGMQLSPNPVEAIGISSPGPLDPRRGIIINSPNLPCWRNFTLMAEIEKRYRLPVRLDNDANAAGLAEALWGAGQNFASVFYATIGTGIGTAIILEKRIYHGRTGAAAEGGHMSIDLHAPVACGCGKHGCLESMASGPAIAARAQARLAHDLSQGAMLLGMAGNGAVTAEAVFDAAEEGDPIATSVVQETVELLAVWLGNVIDLLEPEVIVVGGGVGAGLAPWLPKIADSLRRWTINTRAHEIPLMPAKYGVDSGIAGSAALFLSGHVPRVAERVSGFGQY